MIVSGYPTLIGGYNSDSETQNDKLFAYDPSRNRWRELSQKMRLPRSSAAVFQVPREMFNDC